MTDYVRVDTEDHAALYVDGSLLMWTDAYLVDEYLFYEVLGGTTESSDPFYKSNETFEMPKTLEEYRAFLNKEEK